MPDITKLAGVTRANAYQIPPEQLQQAGNSRRWDDTDIVELADDILIRGQLVTVMVDWDADGNLVVVDGRRRVAAIRYINEKGSFTFAPLKVRCELFKGEKQDAFATAAVTNVKRKGLSPIDLAHCITTLEKEGKTRREIAKILEISEPLISRSLRLLTLSAALQKDIHRGKLSAAAGYELADMPEEERAKTVEQATANSAASASTKGDSGGETGGTKPAVTRSAVRKAKRDRAEAGEETKGPKSRTRKEIYNLFEVWAGCEDGTIEEPVLKFSATMCKFMDGEVGDRAILNRLREMLEG